MSVVLLYHDVAPRSEFDGHGLPGPLAARYKLEPQQFAAHLDAVANTGAHVGLIRTGLDGPSAAFSFDDGGSLSLRAAEQLEAHGWHGHFFVITGLLGSPGFLDADAVRELDRRGHVVGSHSHSHPSYMAQLPMAEIESEWTRSREILADVLGKPPSHAAVPGGDVSPAVLRAAASAGYEVLMTSDPARRVERAGPLLVVGRYPVWGSTRPLTAAAYIDHRRARARLALSWKAKRAAKRMSPRAYERLRRFLVRSR
jgi:peptidoglycan/xylan/chitin deacetylase (PgdA/CDA1 family)